MSRPRTRTARLDPERLRLLQEVFGSSLHAFRVLSPGCSYPVFRRVWDGKEEQPSVVLEIDVCFSAWAERTIQRVKSAA